jgi:hypothetical protein
LYNKADALGLHTFLLDKFAIWETMVDVLRRYGIHSSTQYERISKDLFHIKYRKNSEPEYYAREVKRRSEKHILVESQDSSTERNRNDYQSSCY